MPRGRPAKLMTADLEKFNKKLQATLVRKLESDDSDNESLIELAMAGRFLHQVDQRDSGKISIELRKVDGSVAHTLYIEPEDSELLAELMADDANEVLVTSTNPPSDTEILSEIMAEDKDSIDEEVPI